MDKSDKYDVLTDEQWDQVLNLLESDVASDPKAGVDLCGGETEFQISACMDYDDFLWLNYRDKAPTLSDLATAWAGENLGILQEARKYIANSLDKIDREILFRKEAAACIKAFGRLP
jgi:hypothetical protein